MVRHSDDVLWCNCQASAPLVGLEVPPDLVLEHSELARISDLHFRDPNRFVAGQVHNHPSFWHYILTSHPQKKFLSKIIDSGVNVHNFFRPIKGRFRGQDLDAQLPSRTVIPNNCSQFTDFISKTIIEWLQAGSVSLWGKVDQSEPPHLVLPLTVEPSKPRVCHNERFLNLWMCDLPFTLDYIVDLPRYVLPGHFQTVFDDKNGYQHVLLDNTSRTFFGFQWLDWYFVFRVLPFGWKASAYLYHTLAMVVTGTIRSWGIPISQYIDDRHIGQLMQSPTVRESRLPSQVNAEAAAYIACYFLVRAGYFIGLTKSQMVPATTVCFLGFLVDSVIQAFLIPDDFLPCCATY